MTAIEAPTRRPRRPDGAIGGPLPDGARRPRFIRLVRGRPDDPRWVRPALLGLLVATTVAYLWDLSASGWANPFYAAAVQAGTKSWKAFFFGSFDGSNFITVDKTPGALWVMELSTRLFGVNSWSILAPQALEGVATVLVVYTTVRRWSTPGAGLLAGAAVAVTPVAALMFRFDNPDALLVLLISLSAYATVRGIEDGRARWMVLAGGLVGFGFLAKMLQAFLVVPGLAGAYLVAAPVPLARRIRHLLAGGVALVVAAGWWVAAVQLTPAADRPYIGGSQDNSLWNLMFGYNGFGRLTGNETGSVGGGAGGGGWGATGLTRLFGADMGSQIAWLLPAALLLLVAVLVVTARRSRTDRTRAALILWGGWLLVTGAAFSLGRGIIHPYYTVALAPAIAAAVAIGGSELWRMRTWVGRAVLAVAVAVTAVWSDVLLARSPAWMPELRPLVLALGFMAAAGLLLAPYSGPWLRRAAASVALAACAIGPTAYTLDTIATPHSGAIPSAGPTVTVGARGGFGGPGGGGGGFTRGGFGGVGPTGTGPGGAPVGFGGAPGFSGGGVAGGGGGFAGGQSRGGGGAAGGLLDGSNPSAGVIRYLEAGSGHYTWMAATTGSNEAAGYQLASGRPVMAIGGFNDTDPTPTLAQFEKLVGEGQIHFYIGGSLGGALAGGGGLARQGGSNDASAIASWVESHFTSTTVGGVTVYDLTHAATSS